MKAAAFGLWRGEWSPAKWASESTERTQLPKRNEARLAVIDTIARGVARGAVSE
jgi:hypothetical protein